MSGPTARNVLARISGRLRLPCQAIGAAAVLAGFVLGRFDGAGGGAVALTLSGVALIALALLGTFLGPTAQAHPLVLAPPVQGRWVALNSPATRTPSHGTHAYGQAFAIDLVFAPEGVDRPMFGRAGASFLRSERFPAFGQPVLAPADGVVVRAVDRMRDHRSRSSWAALAFIFLEAVPREALGPTGVLGNHVVLRLADGSHFVLAHLQRGSVAVRRGDRVAAGSVVGRCGSSGNTTEPHLHCQRQDAASVFLATGLPWTVPRGLPRNGEALDGVALEAPAAQTSAGAPTGPNATVST